MMTHDDSQEFAGSSDAPLPGIRKAEALTWSKVIAGDITASPPVLGLDTQGVALIITARHMLVQNMSTDPTIAYLAQVVANGSVSYKFVVGKKIEERIGGMVRNTALPSDTPEGIRKTWGRVRADFQGLRTVEQLRIIIPGLDQGLKVLAEHVGLDRSKEARLTDEQIVQRVSEMFADPETIPTISPDLNGPRYLKAAVAAASVNGQWGVVNRFRQQMEDRFAVSPGVRGPWTDVRLELAEFVRNGEAPAGERRMFDKIIASIDAWAQEHKVEHGGPELDTVAPATSTPGSGANASDAAGSIGTA